MDQVLEILIILCSFGAVYFGLYLLAFLLETSDEAGD